MGLSRREFLRGAAGLITGVGLPACSRPLPRTLEGDLLGPDYRMGHRLRDGASPDPARERRVRVLIVGGGIAGLSAAWRLERAGFDRFQLLELEPEPGGNARSGRSPVSGYPWGAHYLPLPTREAGSLLELLEDLQVVTGRNPDGSPRYEERYLLTPPHERLFQFGLWRPGLRPAVSSRAQVQFDRFDALIGEIARAPTSDGRPAFTTPSQGSSADVRLRALDGLSMAQLLERHGLDDEALRWYVEYGCRDDFGCTLGGTSAWAGVHYHAGRTIWGPYAEGQLLTWPEGNGWIVQQLAGRLREHLECSRLAVRVDDTPGGVCVDAWNGVEVERWRAEQLILCVPGYVAERLLPQAPRCPRQYHPWLVANLHVSRLPAADGAGPAWDSVIYGAANLGYVCATHQQLTQHTGASVLTYYRPYPDGGAAARRGLSELGWHEAARSILDELRPVHPDIDEVVERIDIWRWGHGMVAPAPGLRFSAGLARLQQPLGRVHLAHSDLSGLSLFEEAHYWGVRAAEQVLKKV